MKERIYMASPTMHGEEQKFVQEAFDTNWIAPLGPNVNGFEREMEADTVANFTNHCYFNLAGHNSGPVLDQQVWLAAEQLYPSRCNIYPNW